MILRKCRHGGCNRLGEYDGWCERHKDEAEVKEYVVGNFKKSTVNYADERWRQVSLYMRMGHPWCSRCGESFPIDELIVHHKDEKAEDLIGTEEFYREDNLEVLCRKCHLVEIRKGK